MLDYRIDTFLKVCELMNYREAANALHITQPAVTQHIQYLEKKYDCKLFTYKNRTLDKTREAIILEEYAQSMKYNEKYLKEELRSPKTRELKIGATKTIGDYVLGDYVRRYLKDEENSITLLVDNTSRLLNQLDNNKLDFIIVEGYFDKEKYGYHMFCMEPFVGICHKDHPFAGRNVSLRELFLETLICREEGSGTRAVLEQKLLDYNESINRFKKKLCFSSFKTILEMVKEGYGISFVYEVLAERDEELAIFNLEYEHMAREFNFVYLKNTNAKKKILHFME